MKLAFLSHPLPYGLFTVFRNLREGLQAHGIELRWVGHGPDAKAAIESPQWSHETGRGEVVASNGDDTADCGQALVRHIVDQAYDGVIINPPQTPADLNIVRYLPRRIIRLAIIHASASGIYPPFRGIHAHVHAWVAISPRIQSDLARRFPGVQVVTIPHAIDCARYSGLTPIDPDAKPFRLLSFGRIDDYTKGIFWLPRIFRALDERTQLTVAGDGPDLKRLVDLFGDNDRVTFAGVVDPSRIPELAAAHHAFVMPSRTEGFGYTLIEAMAAGCVPVASRIRGVTDYVIKEGTSGLLFDMGDCAAASQAIQRLDQDRQLLRTMSAAGITEVSQRFNIQQMGDAYAELIRQVGENPREIADPLPLELWHYPREFSPGLASHVPNWVKNLIRKWIG